jgi:uncharacterized protein YoxC
MAGTRKLTLQILGNAKGALTALGQTDSASAKFGTQMSAVSRKVGLAFAGITAAAGYMGTKFVSAAYESQKVMKQTEAVIAATGKAAGMTSTQVADLAESLSMKTGVDDEQIQSSLNMLLTFKQVRNEMGAGNDVFNRASAVMLDLANVFGSTDSAAMQLGKALSDPVRGVTALRRAGVNFTEQQQEQIKTLVASGRTLEAQKLILAEVESQVGGTAAASATAFDKMRVAVGNVQEEIGGLLIPVVERISNYVISNVVPVFEEFAAITGEQGLGAGIEYLSGSILNLFTGLGTGGKIVLGLVSGFAALKVATLTYSGVMGALNVITTVTSGSLSTLITRLGAAKVAMMAAGGVTALLSVAATLYGVYSSKKADAANKTMDLVNALKQEGQAQKEALAQAYRNDSQFRKSIDTLTSLGHQTSAFSAYVQNGTGILSIYERYVKEYNASLAEMNVVTGNASPALDRKAAAIDALREKIPRLRNATDDQVVGFLNMMKVMSGVRAEFKAGEEAMKVFGATAASVTPTVTGTGTAADETGKKTKTLAEKIRDFKTALESASGAQRSFQSAVGDTKKAQDALATATTNVANAQAHFDQIVRGYGAGSTQAADAQGVLEQAQRDATRAGFDLERANYAVTDAVEALNEARAGGNAEEIRLAEIALAEAQFAVTEQQIRQREATDAVTAAQTRLNEVVNGAAEGSTTYKAAQDALTAAQQAQVDATDRLTDAKYREGEATRRLAQEEARLLALKSIVKTKKGKKAVQGFVMGGGVLPQKVIDVLNKLGANIPALASGGIATKATLALIGERAPEAVIPLDRLGDMGGGGGDTFIVNVNSKIADETLPDLLVAELRKFNRRSGAINIQVA